MRVLLSCHEQLVANASCIHFILGLCASLAMGYYAIYN